MAAAKHSYFMIILYYYSNIVYFQWNNHGYDVAKIFGSKFSYVSPVWLQVKRKPGGTFVMQGGHDIDKGKTS